MNLRPILPTLLLALLLPAVQADTPELAYDPPTPISSSFLFAQSTTCNNYGVRVVVSIGDSCQYGTCDNQGILVVVTTGGYCGYGLVDACAGSICVFEKCQPPFTCPSSASLPSSSASLLVVTAYGCRGYGIAVSAAGLCVVGIDTSCAPLPCVESDLWVLSSARPELQESAMAGRMILRGDGCQVSLDWWGILVCGEEDEVCSVLQSPVCWAGRMVCVYIQGPIGEVQELYLHSEEPPCATQPGCCSSAASTTGTNPQPSAQVGVGR